MELHDQIAINAVRNWLVDLLKENKWCQAKRVGQALAILVEDLNRPTLGMADCGGAERIR